MADKDENDVETGDDSEAAKEEDGAAKTDAAAKTDGAANADAAAKADAIEDEAADAAQAQDGAAEGPEDGEAVFGETEDAEPDTAVPPTYEELETEVVELKDQLLRALADAENTRRRAGREKSETSKYAITNFAREVLALADNLARALDSVSDEARQQSEAVETFYAGVEITAKQVPQMFEKFGIKPIEAMGRKFDHNRHQAMFEVEDADQPVGTVVNEIAKGYMIHDRLLRPAMVGVAKGGPKEDAAPNGDGGAKPPPAAAGERTDPSAAYEKQAADVDGEKAGSKVDKEL